MCHCQRFWKRSHKCQNLLQIKTRLLICHFSKTMQQLWRIKHRHYQILLLTKIQHPQWKIQINQMAQRSQRRIKGKVLSFSARTAPKYLLLSGPYASTRQSTRASCRTNAAIVTNVSVLLVRCVCTTVVTPERSRLNAR